MSFKIHLPNEVEASKTVRQSYGAMLDLSSELFSLAKNLLINKTVNLDKAHETDTLVITVSSGIYVKILRLYRAAFSLCQSALTTEAEVLLRSLMESFVAFHFLLMPHVTLRSGNSKIQPLIEQPLTTSFRTALYLAHRAFETLRKANFYKRTPGLKSINNGTDMESLEENVRKAEKEIGPEWTKLLKEKKTYSGLNNRELFTSLGLKGAYDIAYSYMSRLVHAVDALDFIDEKNWEKGIQLKLSPDPNSVPGVISSANASLYFSAKLFDERLSIGKHIELEVWWEKWEKKRKGQPK